MSAYRVEFAETLDDTVFFVGEPEGLSFGRRISAPEEISCSLLVTAANAPQLRNIEAGRVCMYVYDGMDLVSGGVVWDVKPSQNKRGEETLAVSGSTFESYWNQCVITTNIPAATNVDQLEIARSLIQHLQADPHANLGVQFDMTNSGVLRDRTQYLASANLSYGEALSQLGEVENGFEWTIDVYVDPTSGDRRKRLRFGYPIIGGSSVQVVEHLESWSQTTAPTATRYRARGGTPQGSGTSSQQPLLSSVYEATTLLDAGWPRIDQVTDYSTVTSVSTLNSHASRDRTKGLRVRAIPQVTVDLERTRITTASIGNVVRIRRNSLLHGRTDTQHRLIGIRVTAEERGTPGTATLTLEALDA